MAEIEKLLNPISQGAPCGPDLEYDPNFMDLVELSKGKPEREIGSVKIAAEEPLWGEIKEQAEQLFSRTKDLRVAIILTRALTHRDGMKGLALGLHLINSLLTSYWDSVHPHLDQNDEDDPTMRLNVLDALKDPGGLIKDIREVKFIVNNNTKISVRDILIATNKSPTANTSSSNGLTYSRLQIEGILGSVDNSATIQAMRDALGMLNTIQAFIGGKVGTDRTLDHKPISEILRLLIALSDNAPQKSLVDTVTTSESLPSNLTNKQFISDGEIRNREDIVRVLEKVRKYIEHTEPTNPASLIIKLAQTMMTKNFLEILEAIPPEDMKVFKKIIDSDKKK